MSDYFHHVVMPEHLAFGSSGGPLYKTEIVQTASGYEYRNAPWAHSLRRYNLTSGARPLADIQTLLAFFEARRGRLYGFLWRDWMDDRSSLNGQEISATDQPLSATDAQGRHFHIYKYYGSGEDAVARRIRKPRPDNFLLAKNKTALRKDTDYHLDHQNGVVTLNTALARGEVLTAGFHFYVPVRFDTDDLEVQLNSFDTGILPSVPLLEVKLSDDAA